MNNVHHHANRLYGRMVCGALLLSAGLLWLSVKLGWVQEEIVRAIPIIPLAIIAYGAFMLISAVIKKLKNRQNGNEHGSCC